MSKYDSFIFPEHIQAHPMFKSIRTSFMRLPDYVKDLLVAGNNIQYAGKFRRLQMDTTEEELRAIANLCRGKEKPGHYFASITSKANRERTLIYVRRLLARSVEAMAYVAKKITGATKSFMNYVGDKIAEGKYPMNQVVNMVEIACSKKQPDRYLIGILKKGYDHAAPQLRS